MKQQSTDFYAKLFRYSDKKVCGERERSGEQRHFSYTINKQIIYHHFSSNVSATYLVFLGISLSMPSSCQDFHTLHADD